MSRIGTSSGNRPPELDDPEWLRNRLEVAGTMAIALDLGVSRKVVRLACERHGIEGHPAGPRRGGAILRVVRDTDAPSDPTLGRLTARLTSDRNRQLPASETVLASRIRSASEARSANDSEAYEDALLDVASAALLIIDHRRELRLAS